MSCLCVLSPAAEKAALASLCAAAGVDEQVPADVTILRAEILPEQNAWRLLIEGDNEFYPARCAALGRSLAAALGLSRVDVLPESLIQPTTNTAATPATQAEAGVSEPDTASAEAQPATDAIEPDRAPERPCDAAAAYDGAEPPEQDDDDRPMSDDDYMEQLFQRIRENQAEAAVQTEAGEKKSAYGEPLFGQKITQDPQPIKSIQDEERNVVIRGRVVCVNVRDMRSGRRLVSFDVTDIQDTITVKAFAEEKDAWVEQIQAGMWLTVRGPVQYDKFTQELTVLPKDVCTAPPPPGRVDTATQKRVELHLHTKMSALDGVADIAAVIAQAKTWGHPAVAITDHGVVQAFPEAAIAAKKYQMKVLYGTEGYLCDNPDEKGRTSHIIILAANQAGLKNLYRLVSLAHINYFYRKPRVPRQELIRLRAGLILGSACEAGEVYQAALSGVSDEKLDEVASFYDYLEIQPLSNTRFILESGRVASEEALRDINRRILAAGRRLGKPVVATSDAHFINPEDEVYRRILMAGHGFADVENTAPLFLKTTDEMLAEFSYLGEADAQYVVVEASHQIADMVDDLQPIPDGFYPPELEGAAEQIQSMSQTNAHRLYGDPLPELVEQRLQKELKSIIGNGFSSLYLIAHKLVKKSVDDGYMVGSRGSVGSSLVARLCGISEVNPLPPHYYCPACHFFESVEDGSVGSGLDLPARDCPRCGQKLKRDGFDIPFETFLGFNGDKTPDIDLNFSGEYQPRAHKYTEELFGKENVYRAGTIGTLAEKTAFGYVKKYMEEKGQTARTAEMNRLALGLTGVRKTTGQHPGGMIVVPQGRDIYEFTPIQHPANDKESGTITTHFEFTYVHEQLLKLDILGHDGPTMLRMLEDLTGLKTADIPLDDPQTMAIFSSHEPLGITKEEAGATVGTLALPEFNTRLLRQMLEETRPSSFADLVRIMGLSHGTLVWIGNQQDLIKNKTITLAQTVACRDDIMDYLIRKGLPAVHAFKIMEQVRKGKGLKPEDEEAMLQNNVPKWYITVCKNISYMFPKAHAAAYALTAYWQAYHKVHNPLAFYATYFSVRAEDFDAQLVLQGRKVVQKAMKEIDAKGNDATAKEKGSAAMLEVVIEAMARGIEFLHVDLYKSDVRRFQIEDGKLRPPLTSLQGVGESAAESIARARMDRPFTSVEDLKKRGGVSRAVADALAAHGALGDLPESDQLSLF